MKSFLSATLLFLLYSCFSFAQSEPPRLLVRGAQCLIAKQFIASPRSEALEFGYVLDSKSDPGQQVLYMVNYTHVGRSRGMVFTIFLEQQHRVFNINNNGTFVRAGKGVNFTDEPLGGIWTHEHLASAIKLIERRPRYKVTSESLKKPHREIQCESYTERVREKH